MERLSHGALLLDTNQPAPIQPGAPAPKGTVVACPPTTNFDYLFPNNPADRLPNKDGKRQPMAETLIKLGNSMIDSGVPGLDSQIPSVYTYFGQFITHEVVFEVTTRDTKLGPDTVPFDQGVIPTLQNARTTLLDLDSVYGPMLDNHGQCFEVREKGARLALGVAGNGGTFRDFDLLRDTEPPFTALIGDRRNDSNLIISQLHLAFLRAHNKL